MISITLVHGEKQIINADLIVKIVKQGDTLVTLSSGEMFRVKEQPEEIQEKCLEWQRRKWLPIVT